MIFYPDTSFLCAIYREQENSPQADAFRESMAEPLHFTRLLEFEFLQSIQLQVWLNSSDRKKGYPQSIADQMVADWESDVAAGTNELVPCDLDAVLRLSGTFARQRTAKGGHRTLDILHVATAVHLGAKQFLTFDSRQRQLAKYAGLRIPL